MPKWGACWGSARLNRFLEPDQDWDHDVGHRDIYLIECRLDHTGVVESAEADLFIYAVQEVLYILLTHRDAVMEALRASSAIAEADDAYQGLVSSALQMRDLAEEQRIAFWISGDESDRVQLIDAIKRAQLPPSDPGYLAPPHRRRLVSELASRTSDQKARLHRLAQTAGMPKPLRVALLSI